MTILSLGNWLKPLYGRSVLCWHRQRQDRTLLTRLVPRLEVLEDRTVPSMLTVTNNLDTGVAGDGSLRGEIAAAVSGDTIIFAASLAGQTITLTSGKLAINKSLDIKGLGANQLTVSGNNASRVFDITASNASVTIDGLTLTKGRDVTDAIDCIANAGNLTVSNCDVSGNLGYYTSSIVIANTGTLTISHSTVSEISSRIKNTGTLNFSYSTFSGSSSLAIENFGTATVSYSTLSGNKGGAIINRDTGTMTVSYSTLSGNGGTTDTGGAIANYGALTINNSTLSGNTAVGSPGFDGLGGAIYMRDGTLALNSSTLSGNRVYGGDSVQTTSGGLTSPGSGQGGGLYIVAGTVTIDHSTIAGNEAHGGIGLGYSAGVGGGIYQGTSAAAIQMHDTILANNIANAYPDLSGSITSRGHNLIGNSAGGSGFVASDLLNVNPKLGPLQNNGGPTLTMALLAGSPAIDAGDNTDAPAYDQRGPGFPRIVNGIIDIGAFEVQAAPSLVSVPIHDGSVQRSMVPSLTIAFNGVVTLDSGALPLQGPGWLVPEEVPTSVVGNQTVAVIPFTGSAGGFSASVPVIATSGGGIGQSPNSPRSPHGVEVTDRLFAALPQELSFPGPAGTDEDSGHGLLSAAPVGLDPGTLDRHNHASTNDDDCFGC